MSKRETSSEIDEAAALWATRIDEAALDDETQARFDAWLEGDIRRVGAFARAQAVLVHARRAKALGAEFDPASFGREDSGAAEQLVEETRPDTKLTRRGMLIGASAVAATGAAAVFIPARSASARIYETGRGESRLIPLADGSTVTLNTNSRIAVGAERNVKLLAGEALFKIAAASAPAPFTVEAGDASLRAQAATFSVCRLDSEPLEISVCAGDVEVERGTFLSRKKHMLHANMQATLADGGEFVESEVPPRELERKLSWQEGMLSFEDTPLSEAAREFGRYSDRTIRIADRAVGAETVTGRFAANDPEGFARAVALGLDLHARPTPGGIILARR